MATEVRFPKFGLTMTEGTLLQWHKEEGQQVEKGEILFEIESEKAVMEVEASASGVLLRVQASAGDIVPVSQVIAWIGQAGEVPGAQEAGAPETVQAPVNEGAEKTESPPKPGLETGGRIVATPIARRLAKESGLDLSLVGGTGPRGRITKEDVEIALTAQAHAPRQPDALQPAKAAVDVKERVVASPVARRLAEEAGVDLKGVQGTGPRGRISKEDVQAALAVQDAVPPVEPESAPEPVESLPAPALKPSLVLPFAGVRKTIADRMSLSAHTTAPVTLTLEADATELVKLRQSLKLMTTEADPAPTYNDILIKVVARALTELPDLNARLVGDEIQQVQEINVGLAVDTANGLVVPVVRNADQLTLRAVADATRQLIERFLEGRFLPEDLQGGTFTITNLGAFEIDAFTPIINPPECAILGVGQIAPKAVVRDGQLVARSMVALSLTFDHRLVDGAPAARFLQRVKQLVENPLSLLI